MQSIGPYRLDAELGRGAMGVVFRGFDPAIGRAVAIKIIRLDQFATANEKAEVKLRFAREAAAAGRLSHPNIVTVYQLGEQGDLQFLALELVDGCSLEKTLSDGIPHDRKLTLSILSQVADALDYAHGEGVVHRDVKPANILVLPDGKAKITDFGIARISSQTVTKTGFTMGTPAYMAPEQIMSAKVNGRADQFSLAVIAYQMLSGRRPFVAETDPGLIIKIVSEEPPPLHESDRSFPPRTSDVLRKGLAKDPNQRFATCAELIKDLAASLELLAPAAPVALSTPVLEAGLSAPAAVKGPRAWVPGWPIALGAAALVGSILLLSFGFLERSTRHPVVPSASHATERRSDATDATPGPRPAEVVTSPPATATARAGRGSSTRSDLPVATSSRPVEEATPPRSTAVSVSPAVTRILSAPEATPTLSALVPVADPSAAVQQAELLRLQTELSEAKRKQEAADLAVASEKRLREEAKAKASSPLIGMWQARISYDSNLTDGSPMVITDYVTLQIDPAGSGQSEFDVSLYCQRTFSYKNKSEYWQDEYRIKAPLKMAGQAAEGYAVSTQKQFNHEGWKDLPETVPIRISVTGNAVLSVKTILDAGRQIAIDLRKVDLSGR